LNNDMISFSQQKSSQSSSKEIDNSAEFSKLNSRNFELGVRQTVNSLGSPFQENHTPDDKTTSKELSVIERDDTSEISSFVIKPKPVARKSNLSNPELNTKPITLFSQNGNPPQGQSLIQPLFPKSLSIKREQVIESSPKRSVAQGNLH